MRRGPHGPVPAAGWGGAEGVRYKTVTNQSAATVAGVQGLCCLESGHGEVTQNRRAGEIEESLIKLSLPNLRAIAFPLWSL